jgi:hypothetical protein
LATARIPEWAAIAVGRVPVSLEDAMHPDLWPYRANCQTWGVTQSGKSNGCELHCEEAIARGLGVCYMDFSGPSYDNLAAYCARIIPMQKVYLVNLTDGRRILPLDLLSGDPVQVAETVLRSWGNDIREMPTYKDMAAMVFRFSEETAYPAHLAVRLLYPAEKQLRVWAYLHMKDRHAKATLSKIIAAEKSPAAFDKTTSAYSRLGAFAESKTLTRFLGLPPVASIEQIIREQAVLLVKAAPSKSLSPQAAKTYLALLLAAFLHADLPDEIPFFVWCDEAHQYMTQDSADLLDLTVKRGLRFTLIHHHNEQFKDPHLRASVDQNCAIKYIYDGLPVSEKKRMVEECFLRQVNEPMILEQRERLLTEYVERKYEIESGSSQITHYESGDGAVTESAGGSAGTRFVPVQSFEYDSVYYTREQQVSLLAEKFLLPRGSCVLKLPDGALRIDNPRAEKWGDLINPEDVLEFDKHSIPADEGDRELAEIETRFEKETGGSGSFERRTDDEPRKNKGQADLCPQG